MTNLHTSLDSTRKSRFSKIFHQIPSWGVYSKTFILHSEMKLKNFPMLVSGGVHSTTFDPELRNERFTLISFMEFHAILSTLQPFEIYTFNRK